MTVWSVTPLFNELDLLEVRLRELDGVVDIHVICESPVTYAGALKPLHYAEQRDRFEEWEHKIRYVVSTELRADTLQRTGDRVRWQRENGQRASLGAALDGLSPTDVVILSDLDEIPRASLVERYRRGDWRGLIAPQVPMYLYRVGLRIDADQASLLRLGRGRDLRGSPEDLRRAPARRLRASRPAEFGWHLSYFGGVDAVRYKVAQAAHPEENIAAWVDPANLADCIATGRDHRANRTHAVLSVGTDEWPDSVRGNEVALRTMIDPVRFPADRLLLGV